MHTVLQRVPSVAGPALVCGILSAAALAFVPGRPGILAGCALIAVLSLPLVRRLAVDWLDPVGLYAVFTVLVFAVATLNWLVDPFNRPPGIDYDDVREALALVAACVVALAVGTTVAGRPLPTEAPHFRPTPGSALVRIGSFFGVGLLSTLAAFALSVKGYEADVTQTRGLPAFAEPLLLLSLLGPLSILAAALSYFRAPTRALRTGLLVMVAVQCGAGFVAGFKGQAVLPVEFVLLAYIAVRGRVPWKWLAATAAIFLLVVLPAVGSLRTHLASSGTLPADVLAAVTDVDRLRPDNSILQAEQYMSSRFRHIDPVALIVRDTPSVYPYADGATYTPRIIFQAVPRSIWPTKPVLDQSSQFAHTYWQIPQAQTTANPMTQVGDLYRNFGPWGALLGMLCVGLVLGVYQRYVAQRRSARITMVHIFVLVNFVAFATIENELPILAGSIAKTLPIALLAAWLLQPSTPGIRHPYHLRRKHVVIGCGCAVAALGVFVVSPNPPSAPRALKGPTVAAAIARDTDFALRVVPAADTNPALVGVRATYTGRAGPDRLLILVFESPSAISQVMGKSTAVQAQPPNVLSRHNVVVIYDTARGSDRISAVERALVSLPV